MLQSEFNLQSLICNLQSAIDMTDLDRLNAALADRYAIEEELGAGGTWMNIE